MSVMAKPTEKPVVLCDMDGTLFDPSERRRFVEPRWKCLDCGSEQGEGYWKAHYVGAELCCGDLDSVPKDWSSFFATENVLKDRPVPQVVDMVQRLATTHEIHIVTARREADREVTELQLRHAGIPYAALHIVRPDGEHTPDDVLKREWLEDSGLKDRVWLVLDDRDSVVAMWRAQGLVCWQVAEGNF